MRSPAARRRACALGALALLVAALAPAIAAGQGGPRWGWLGVRIRDLSEQEMDEISRRHGIREGFGAMIVEVLDGTPAEASGLRNGDLVVGVGDRPVVDTRTLQRAIASAGVGETAHLTVLRGEEGRRRIAVRLGPMPDAVLAERIAAEFGFLVREPDARPELGRPGPSPVPAVAAVVPGGRAASVGLRAGDILVEVNGRAVPTLQAVREALLGAALARPLPLVVRRAGASISLVVPPPETP